MNSPRVSLAARNFLTAALMSAALAPRAPAQADPKSPHVQTMPAPGVSQVVTPSSGALIMGQVMVGQPAPAFELDSSLGKPIQLTSLRGDWTLLIFLPRMTSAPDFAPLQRTLDSAAVQMVGICHERARSVESFAQRNPLAWLLLADVTGEVGGMYGVWDPQVRGFTPGFFLIDPRGIVRYASVGRALSPDEVRDIVMSEREKS